MSIKRIFIVISAIFAASAVFADNSSVTSRKYVDDFMTGYQDKIPGSGNNKLMIYDESPDGIGEKNIVSSLGSNTSATDVPNVGAVKTGLNGKQDTINGTAGYVMTGTGNPGTVGEKPIYSSTNNYTDALVTAEMVNTGITNAVNSSLIRVDENGAPDSNGLLWEINTNLLALSVRPMLPDGYTQLQYIQSTGTQYIDTGFHATDKYGAYIKYRYPAINNSGARVFGNRDSNNENAYAYIGTYAGTIKAGTQFYIASFDSKYWSAVDIDTNVHEVSINTDGLYQQYFDNIYITNVHTQTFTRPETTRIFSAYNGNNGYSNAAAAVYACKIYNDGVEIANYIPARRDTDGKIGMYDVTDSNPATAFHTNAATSGSDFTAGPSCVSPNLFDGNITNYAYTVASGNLVQQSPDYRSIVVKVEPGKTYTFSRSTAIGNRFVYFFTSEKPQTGVLAQYINKTYSTSTTNFSFTVPDGMQYFVLYVDVASADVSGSQFMVEEGSTATTYRPYGENICD